MEMPARSEKILREAALTIAQYLPADDDAKKICDLALQLCDWRDVSEPLAEPPDKTGK